nr:protein gamete expressed 1 [Quercus suber]
MSWGWFSSSAETQFDEKAFDTKDNSGPAKFSMEVFNDQKGARLVEGARMKLAGSKSCWQNAYWNLFAGCLDIFSGMRSDLDLLGILVIAF